MPTRKMTLAEAANLLRVADSSLDAFAATAPQWTERVGGRQALAARCEIACVGPVPRLTAAEWEGMVAEYAARHWQSPSIGRA